MKSFVCILPVMSKAMEQRSKQMENKIERKVEVKCICVSHQIHPRASELYTEIAQYIVHR